MALQPRDEPVLFLERFPLLHDDFVLLALRSGAGRRRRIPAKQPTYQTPHSGIALKA